MWRRHKGQGRRSRPKRGKGGLILMPGEENFLRHEFRPGSGRRKDGNIPMSLPTTLDIYPPVSAALARHSIDSNKIFTSNPDTQHFEGQFIHFIKVLTQKGEYKNLRVLPELSSVTVKDVSGGIMVESVSVGDEAQSAEPNAVVALVNGRPRHIPLENLTIQTGIGRPHNDVPLPIEDGQEQPYVILDLTRL